MNKFNCDILTRESGIKGAEGKMAMRNFSRYIVTHGWTISEASRLLLLAISNARRSLTRQRVRFCRVLLQRQLRTWFACRCAAKCRGRRRTTVESEGALAAKGIYGHISALLHFSGERIACLFMPRNSPAAGRAVYRAASAKTANGFASRPQPPR